MSDLTFGNITFKASHNSYERDESLADQLTFNASKPYNGGCMALEFDIWRHSEHDADDADFFTVSHVTPGSTTLKHYLDEILDWHNDNPDHNVRLITLDIKSSHGGYDHFHDSIDTYLKTFFGADLIFQPNALLEDSDKSLCENVIENGWPKLDDLTGKFIFCLSGNKDWKSEYARTDLEERICFSDLDKSDKDDEVSPPTSGDIVFFNFHIYNSHRGVWMNTLPPFAEVNLITRAYVADSDTNWRNCIYAKVSAIATNKICDHDWCKVNDDSAVLEKTPLDKRYLKNKANGEYRNDHATKMQDTYEDPECTFIFESYGDRVYAIRNAKNGKYLDCSITTMADEVKGDCQKWKLIYHTKAEHKYYIRNCENDKYLTKRASKLSDSNGEDEIYIVKSVD